MSNESSVVDPWSTTTGSTVVDLLDASTLLRLRAMFEALDLEADRPYFASNVHCPPDEARRLDAEIGAALRPFVTEFFPDHEPFLAAFISKGGRDGARVRYHQDWTYTDERHARVVIAWIPLVDVGVGNGALQVVDGSHRWSTNLRPAPGRELGDAWQTSLSRMARLVPMNAGQMLVYDPALFHGSSPNVSNVSRPVAAIALAPRDAQLVHFHRESSGALTGFQVDRRYFTAGDFEHVPDAAVPVEPWAAETSSADLGAFVQPAGELPERPRPKQRSSWRVGPIRRERVLRDGDADDQLAASGFTVIHGLLPDDALAELRRRHRRLYGPCGDGLVHDADVPEPAYRAATGEAIAGAIGDVVERVGVAWEPALLAYLCQGTGAVAGSHRSRTVVGERADRATHTVWIAVDDWNMSIEVVPGSNRDGDRLAPTSSARSTAIGPAATVDLAPGDALVMAANLDRAVLTNPTDEPRLIVVAEVRSTAPTARRRSWRPSVWPTTS